MGEGLHDQPTIATSQDGGAPTLWGKLTHRHELTPAIRGSLVCQELMAQEQLPHCLGVKGVPASTLPLWWDAVIRSWLSHGSGRELLHRFHTVNTSDDTNIYTLEGLQIIRSKNTKLKWGNSFCRGSSTLQGEMNCGKGLETRSTAAFQGLCAAVTATMVGLTAP